MEQPGGEGRRFPKLYFLEKRPSFNLLLAGLFSFVDYFTSIMTREMMIAIRVPKAIIKDNASKTVMRSPPFREDRHRAAICIVRKYGRRVKWEELRDEGGAFL